MIPYPYNLVDMGGIDLAEANGTVVSGLYAKIVEAVNACGDVVLYNWKFASIDIAPQHTQILIGTSSILINSVIQVTELDEVSILGLEPPGPIGSIVPLIATENGEYSAVEPVAGFSPVTVQVPMPDPPVLVPLTITGPGTYYPQDYEADGFSLVEYSPPQIQHAVHVWTNSTGGSNASVYVQTGTMEDGVFVPDGEAVSVLYTTVSTWHTYSIIQLRYGAPWQVQGIVGILFNGDPYPAFQTAASWAFNSIVDYMFVEQI